MILVTLMSISSLGQNSEPTDKLKTRLQSINIELADAFLKKNIEVISKYYNREAVCMPEYHRTLTGKNDILQYFQQWFKATVSNNYKRTIYEVQLLNGYLLETGTFKNDFTKTDSDLFVYEGKYVRIWKVEEKETLTILSEIWGASDYLDRTKLPSLGNGKRDGITEYDADKRIIEEVKERNRIITELVKNRRGEEHATFFTKDAVYMPYYLPMLIGLDNIKSYFIEHEKPGDINIDSLQINASNIIDMGNFVLEHGYYGVRWRSNDNNTGIVTGKSINLWKRDDKGTLMLYRQMVNHD